MNRRETDIFESRSSSPRVEFNVEAIEVYRPEKSSVASEKCPGYVSSHFSKTSRFFKRTFDIVISIILLIVLSPVFLICYIVLRLDGGPAIYKQERIGMNARPFNIYKFRSMRVDAEKEGPQLCASLEEEHRLTRVGRFLRRYHLDELPQLWNVLIGDMSFIGPRPERQYFIDKIMERDPRYECLYQIRPGVTSYATIYNGYTDTIDKMLKRLEYDLDYLRNGSFWFDVKILFKTLKSIFKGGH